MKNIAVIGTGQQGASIVRALLKSDAYYVRTYDEDPDVNRMIADMAGDHPHLKICKSIKSAVSQSMVTFLATPIDRFADVLNDMQAFVSHGHIISDIGSGKVKSIAEIVDNLPDGSIYIPGHPIVGRAHSGPGASDPQMYNGETIVIVPGGEQQGDEAASVSKAQDEVAEIWGDMGGVITYMDAKTHDYLYGTISHFQHIVAFSMVMTGINAQEDYMSAGNILRDMTRVAGGASADMWVPIFRDNHDAIMQANLGFISQLHIMKSLIQQSDEEVLQGALQTAHDFRKTVIEHRQRENIHGEINDVARQFGQETVDIYDMQSVFHCFDDDMSSALIWRCLMPTVIAGAVTLNAMKTEGEYLKNIAIAEVANPSFKDGSAPMLNAPEILAALLCHYRQGVLNAIDNFEMSFTKISHALKTRGWGDLREHIKSVSLFRQKMPAHRQENELRDHFVF